MARVHCFKIKYTGKEAIISITGQDALKAFAETGYLTYYGSEEAPKEITICLPLKDNWFDNLDATETMIKNVLEEETGLKVEKFSWTVLN